MKRFDPNKLSVEFRDGVTEIEPLENRKYTVTHSDLTGELFLTIAFDFAYDKINELRDEVFAEWKTTEDGERYLYVYVYIDGQNAPMISSVRNEIFRRELPMALEVIRYGDRTFIEARSELGNAPIWIQFDSANPAYNRYENWGSVNEYSIENEIISWRRSKLICRA